MGYFMKRHPPVSAAEIRQQWKHLSWSRRTGVFRVIVDRLFERDPWIALGLLFYLAIAGFQGSEFRWCPTHSLPNTTPKRSLSRIFLQSKKKVFKPCNNNGVVPWLISPQTGADFFFEIEELNKYLLFFRKMWLVGMGLRAGYAEGRWRARNSELSLCSHKVKVTSWLPWFRIPISKAGEPCWPPICRKGYEDQLANEQKSPAQHFQD